MKFCRDAPSPNRSIGTTIDATLKFRNEQSLYNLRLALRLAKPVLPIKPLKLLKMDPAIR